jgi:hypothetical protein
MGTLICKFQAQLHWIRAKLETCQLGDPYPGSMQKPYHFWPQCPPSGNLMWWEKKRGLVTVIVCACVFVLVVASLGKHSSPTFHLLLYKWGTRSEPFKSYPKFPHIQFIYILYVYIWFIRHIYIICKQKTQIQFWPALHMYTLHMADRTFGVPWPRIL